MKPKQYLGDAVYIKQGRFGDYILTTEDGIKVLNEIILEPEVTQALLEYINKEKEEKEEESTDWRKIGK